MGERYRDEFEVDDGSVWLNTAHQGRLPRRAAEALREALRWKLHPELLVRSERFSEVPARLRRALAQGSGRVRTTSSSGAAERQG